MNANHQQFAAVALPGALPQAQRAQVIELAARTAIVDGVEPLSEVPLIKLRQGDPDSWHVLIYDPETPGTERLLGYAQLDLSGENPSAELLVRPSARRRGIGSRLVAELEFAPNLRIWAHGDLPAAQGFAAALGYRPVRELLQLGRPLHPPVVAPNIVPLPEGYRTRTFTPGADDAAWVELNAQVFADHPEQGRLTVDDLQARQQEPWFYAQDFLLVSAPDGQLAGFCWGKVTAATSSGEIYAIGVAPAHQRLGIAKHLLELAFAHLAAAGLAQVTLYVEGDNEAALAAYYKAGFAPLNADVQYAKFAGSTSESVGD